MKIMVCGLNYAPEVTGIGKYTSEMCEWLAARGHEVHVVTSYPHYPAWKVPTGFSSWRFSKETLSAKLTITRCPLYVPGTPSTLRRLLSQVSFAMSGAIGAIGVTLRMKPDVVVTIAPSLIASLSALIAARLSRSAAWIHQQDLEVEAAFGLGMVHGARLLPAILRLEAMFLRRFDRVSTISSRMVDAITEKGVPAARITEIRNWVDTDTIRPIDRETAYRQQIDIAPDALVALYSGSMVAKQGLGLLEPVMREFAEKGAPLVFLLCGNGVMRADLERRTSDLPNVRFLDLQPVERLPELLATADIHLLPQRAEIMDLVMPSKLPPMLASGRPVVAMAAKGTQVACEVEGHGLVVPPGDEYAFVAALGKLIDDSELRRRLGEAGRARAVAHWNKEGILLKLEARLAELALQEGEGRLLR
ncbi:WcaI family glycosyltransferase [Terrihabitans sp. B22-R8]|uniref:WcaI family glycosyltransferase n=1 Tax=Terrihabitans sp. B22-R8 TaxID=3425128 RepID=UPI00403D309F